MTVFIGQLATPGSPLRPAFETFERRRGSTLKRTLRIAALDGASGRLAPLQTPPQEGPESEQQLPFHCEPEVGPCRLTEASVKALVDHSRGQITGQSMKGCAATAVLGGFLLVIGRTGSISISSRPREPKSEVVVTFVFNPITPRRHSTIYIGTSPVTTSDDSRSLLTTKKPRTAVTWCAVVIIVANISTPFPNVPTHIVYAQFI